MHSKSYSVVELARLAGVTERTLRYYDEIGLLPPRKRSEKGVRQYGRDELYRLQQIMLYREIGYSLDQVREILDDPGFDLVSSLTFQREKLHAQVARTRKLIERIDKTIESMQDPSRPLSDRDLYEGLSEETIEAYRREAIEKWGEEVHRSEMRLRQMNKADIRALKREGEGIVSRLAGLMRLAPSDPIAQKAVGEYYAHLNKWTPTPKERFRALADVYAEDERFRDNFDKHGRGLAEWLREAIRDFTS